LVSEQSKYSLLDRMVELEVVPASLDYGLGLIPWSPLAGGVLAGPPEAEGRRNDNWVADVYKKKGDQLGRWYDLCKDMGEQPADVALAWLLHQPVVTAPIIGPRTLAQLDGSLRALEIKLDAETLTKIDDIFPPYKTAPEHYAW